MSSILQFSCATAAALALFYANVTAATDSGQTALRRLEMLGLPSTPDAFARAVATRHRPLIDLCFAAHLEVDAPDKAGRRPILIAALNDDWPTAQRLLRAGAKVITADAAGTTPLMAAAMHGNLEMLRAFAALQVSADVTDSRGRAAIHYAITANQFDAVAFLLPRTANLTATCMDGENALGMAFQSDDPRISQAVSERIPSTQDWNPATLRALTALLAVGDKDRIRQLLAKHHAPPTPAGLRTPLLAYAISMNETPLFNMLLACGADPNTVIPSPCEKEFLATVSATYLRHYLEGDSNITVLMLAASLGNEDIVKALLDAGASRNRATPKHKMLALYFATRSDSWRAAQLLLGSGPSPERLRVEVSLGSQEATVFQNGVPIFTTEVSTGRKGFSTPPGRYVVTDKNRAHRSTIYKVPMPYFMRLSCRDFGMHEGIVRDEPASHGCIRLPSGAARKLFAEIPVGTLVSIN